MGHVVFCWELGAGYGHLVPIHTLAHRFIAQGHKVTALIRSGKGTMPIPDLDGLELLAAPIIAPPPRDFPLSLNYSDNLRRNGYWHADALMASLGAWRRLFAQLQPDLLVADHAPGALLASQDAAFPRLALGMGFTLPPRLSPMPGLQPWFPLSQAQLSAREDEFLGDVNPVMQRLGLRPLAQVADIFAGVERLLCAYPELDHYDERPAENWWGPLLHTTPLPAPNWPENDGAGVFVYMSSANRFLAAVLEGLSSRGVPVLAFVRGKDGRPARPISAPGIRYLDGLVNLDTVAANCLAAVTEGGFGSMASFLKHGRPLLICPLELEQALLAWRLRARKLADGLSLFSPLSTVADRLDRLLACPPRSQALLDFTARHGNHDAAQTAAAISQKCLGTLPTDRR